MKIVLNRTYGGFHYGEGFVQKYGYSSIYDYLDMEGDSFRTDPRLVNWIENNPSDNPSLKVYEIPDNVTDWQIHEYDGMESIICVIDGKIVWL